MFSRDVHMYIEEHKKKYAPFPMHRKEFASQNIYVNYLRNLYTPSLIKIYQLTLSISYI